MELKPLMNILIGNFYFKVYLDHFTIHEQLDHAETVIGKESCTPVTAASKCLAFAIRHEVYDILKFNISGTWI